MSLLVFFSVLGAAFLHALWNSLVKTGTSRLGAMVAMSVVEAPIGLAVAAFCAPLPLAAWPWIAASGTVHFFYKFFLAQAYARGDLSRVYPIARGTAPLLVALSSGLFLSDVLTLAEAAGIVVLGLGILAMAQGVFANGEDRRQIPYALATALTVAVYTMVDGQGARISGDAVAYVAWVFVVDGVSFALGILAWKGMDVLPRQRRPWVVAATAAASSYGAYGISVWAMTVAPIALVAALRETSILFAVLIGWLGFGEKMTRGKALAAAIIIAGVVLTRL